MRAEAYHSETCKILERRRIGVALAGAKAGELVDVRREGKLPRKVRWGVWVWVALIGASLTYELVAFFDGPGGQPTLSQLVKGMVLAGGRFAAFATSFALVGAAVVLILHWAWQVF